MRWTLACWLLGPLLLTGCPEPSEPPDPQSDCQRIGERCVLPNGVVGICNDTGRTDCESLPCLDCMPQH